ncbi:MAG: threonine synthase [Gammaproteobacteria bacterium]
MSFVSHLRGIGSGAVYPPDAVMNLCPVDGRPVEIVLDIDRLRAERPAASWYLPARRDMWRFGGLLPLDAAVPEEAARIVSLGEGATPLLDGGAWPLAGRGGFGLQIKEEGRPVPGFGANPTRSFKDRGMAMVATQARRLGLRRLVVPTQGNAGDSLAEYALAAGLEVAVVMPDDTPQAILGRVRALAERDPRVQLELVRGTIREAGARVKSHWVPAGWFSAATFQEPGWRIEGKKTLGLELAEPASPGAGWRLPDVIVYPTGGGTGLLGMWKAFAELEALGVVGPERPRMIAVQSQATRPLVEAFESGAMDTHPGPAGATLAVGLNVPGGVGHFRVLEILRASGGGAFAVGEAAMRTAFGEARRALGLELCPEGAACMAVLPRLFDEALIRAGDRVVVVNTCAPEKYLPEVEAWYEGA